MVPRTDTDTLRSSGDTHDELSKVVHGTQSRSMLSGDDAGGQSYRNYLQTANRLTEEGRSHWGFYAHKSGTHECPAKEIYCLELTNNQLTGVKPVLTEFVEKLAAKLNGTDYDPRDSTSRRTDVETSPTGRPWQICSNGDPALTRAVKGRQTKDDLRIRAVLKKVSSTAESSDTAKVEDQDAVA